MQRNILLGISLFAMGLVGCATTRPFGEAGFLGQDSAYFVSYQNEHEQQLLPSDWMLSNFDQDPNGRPTRMRTDGIYRSNVDWLWGDGKASWVTFVTHELKFTHRASDASIWVRVLPIPASVGGKTLKVLAESWAHGLNGTVLDYTFSSSVDAHRIATKLTSSKVVNVSGQPAYEVTFDLVNLDQLQLDANAPRTRVRAIFISGPLQKRLDSASHDAVGGLTPAVLFVGISARADIFDSQVPAFGDFCKRIKINKKP
jgi:hypothetical protein